ncbi:MAG: Trx7/PDZ domain-containing (seleno)protein [Roseimicrobium sp.]
MKFSCTLALGLGLAVLPIAAEAVKDREGAVRKDRDVMQQDARWVYNDVPRGFAEAKRTGKPLLVVLRCVPCLACMGIDGSVLTEPSLSPLLDQYVCVRLINANAIDLAQFQFDYDLSFSTLIFNGDGTVYGRFGSWLHQRNPHSSDTASFRSALTAALDIHRGYPANKASLAGKQGVTMPFKTPVEIPQLAGKYQRELQWEGQVAGSCVHCHMVGAAMRSWYREQRKPMPEQWLFPMPPPEVVGLEMDRDASAKVRSVVGGSHAQRAGLKAGDEIVSCAGQPLISVADMAWALHQTPSSSAASLSLVVKRAGKEETATLELPAGWKERTDTSKRVAAWTMRGMVTGGLVLTDMDGAARIKRGFTQSQMALVVKSVGQYGKHAAGKRAGFQAEDVIVELDGKTERRSESQTFGSLLRTRMPGENVKAVILRGQERLELVLPMQ